ncbi:hypothetical protein AVEN_204197-1 [Araneus ventricosus]|uniref:HAT C-terminal dimerisation domain-containing protein n=1 Tax=Araneus ventricosus TaxID=182803 RepID=A0A4Y2S4B6_ARAVE|nr:hypothetical protein AVEN_204197-1 [Araneus ventricosus]
MEASKKKHKTLESFFSKPSTNAPPNPKSEGITSTCTSETNLFNERELLLLPSSSTSEVKMETDLPSQSDDENEIQIPIKPASEVDEADYNNSKSKWPCIWTREMLNVNETKNSYRDYLENSSVVPKELIPLMNCSSLIPCSSSECERGFSQMNIMVTPTRLSTSNISSLMFINLNGPNIRKWKPELYVRTWLRKHRSADDTRTKRVKPAENIDDVVNENVFP